jgi:hypothetical protein
LLAVTSNVGRLLPGDHKIKSWREANLLYPSVVTGIVRTIKRDMITRRLGALAVADLKIVQSKLREILAL